MIVLQNLVCDITGRPEGSRELYIRGDGLDNRGGTLDFSTYFNSFNRKKWKEYCGVNSLNLILEVSGDVEAVLHGDGREISRHRAPDNGILDIQIPAEYGGTLLSVKLESRTGGEFRSGKWGCPVVPETYHPVKIALVFCTFNRDEYLFANLSILAESLPDNYGVFIVDNGRRIPREALECFGPRFRLFHNNNTGGSGGFTRGIVEALRDDEEWTHVHLMDDDVSLEPESLFRSSVFLSLLKREYGKSFISGSMLRMDKPWELHENTARWTGTFIKGHNKGLDLRTPGNVLENEKEYSPANRFAAWWYCIIPLSEDMEHDLPFPFFIYGDDMEYSLRRAEHIISLNGIAVWHEPFEGKYNAVMKNYFLSRNLMILNTLRSGKAGCFGVFKRLLINYLVQISVHDYASVRLVLKSLGDYLKGPEYVLSLDSEAVLKELRGSGKPMIPAGSLPAKGYTAIGLSGKKYKAPLYFFKKRIAAYDHGRQNMELRVRSWREIFSLTGTFLKLGAELLRRYGSIRDAYGKIRLDREFWDGKNLV